MAPGQRADVLVQAGVAGSYALRAIGNDQGYPSPVGPVARVVVAGDPLAMALPTALGKRLVTIGDGEITNTRRLTLSVKEPEFPPPPITRSSPISSAAASSTPIGRSAHSPGRGRGMDRRQRA
jgi:hypothetical protein